VITPTPTPTPNNTPRRANTDTDTRTEAARGTSPRKASDSEGGHGAKAAPEHVDHTSAVTVESEFTSSLPL